MKKNKRNKYQILIFILIGYLLNSCNSVNLVYDPKFNKKVIVFENDDVIIHYPNNWIIYKNPHKMVKKATKNNLKLMKEIFSIAPKNEIYKDHVIYNTNNLFAKGNNDLKPKKNVIYMYKNNNSVAYSMTYINITKIQSYSSNDFNLFKKKVIETYKKTDNIAFKIIENATSKLVVYYKSKPNKNIDFDLIYLRQYSLIKNEMQIINFMSSAKVYDKYSLEAAQIINSIKVKN